MSLEVLTQGGGAGGETASIFVTGLDENSTVTATKDGKTVRGKWAQKENPAYVVPDGYTQFEYIQSTGTQYINSKIIPSASTGVRVKTMPLTANTGTVLGAITGIGSGYFGITSYQSMWDAYWGASTGVKGNIGVNTWSELKLNYMNDKQFTDDGVLLTSLGSVTITTNPVHIFRMNPGTYSDPQYYVGRIAELVFTVGTEITNNFVPAKRNSDGAIGMLDVVTGVFESNAGTGAFIAGKEVPQYIYGFEIAPIKEYGMYTVTATNGENTTTQDVLVDAAVEYAIFMDLYKLWLYREGDECEEITSGWHKNINATIYGDSSANGAVEFQDDNIFIVSTRNNAVCVTANNKISFANYTKFGFVITEETQDGAAMVGATMLFATSTNSGAITTGYALATYADADGVVKEVDISNFSDSYYISYATNGIRSGRLKQLWLE